MTTQFRDMSLPLPEATPPAEPRSLRVPWDGRLAVTIDGIPWTILWALARGRPEPIGIIGDGTRTVSGFPIELVGKLGPIIAAALRNQALCHASYGETRIARQLRRWADAAERPPGRLQYDEALLRTVAAAHNDATSRGEYPARAVYDAHLGESTDRLNRYIQKARDHCLIPLELRRSKKT
jgi:hypothetical protein